MKKGRIVVLDEVNSKPAAALLVNGQIHDLLIEADNNLPKPEAIYRGRTTLPMKGQNGIILDIITKVKTKAHTSQILESK